MIEYIDGLVSEQSGCGLQNRPRGCESRPGLLDIIGYCGKICLFLQRWRIFYGDCMVA